MDAVYLDHAATTPVRDEVREAMAPFLEGRFGNPSSTHRWGRAARVALDESRARIAQAIGASTREIHFVRGGTESDNLAVLGGHEAMAQSGACAVAVSTIEHSAVLEPARRIAALGHGPCTEIAVGADGTLDMEQLHTASHAQSTLVSVMLVNNETGIVLPVRDVAALIHQNAGVVHTDACQALGKVPVDVDDLGVDLLTATGHKINGPKGAGFLYLRSGTEVAPRVFGGKQEQALRPGTEDVAGAVGLATSVELAVREQVDTSARFAALRDRLENGLRSRIPGVRVNGGDAPRSPHVSSIGLPGIHDGSALLMALDLDGVAVSGGSACHSGSAESSHVISALYGSDDPLATVRFSFGRTTTDADVDRALEVVPTVVERMTVRGVPA